MVLSKANFSLFWLLVVAILGVTLRAIPVLELQLDYQNVLQAHSHVAFLGWVFTALFALVYTVFLEEKHTLAKNLNRQFYLSQFAVFGMLISFPFTGYGPVSIFFCTLHMIVSIWFAYTTYKGCRTESNEPTPLSVKFLLAALGFMVISSAGPLSLPVVSKVFGKGSDFYSNAIYFYLHFQYNGWFIFTLLALLFRRLENKQLSFPRRAASYLFRGLLVSCILTYFLSVLWTKPPAAIWVLAFTGASIQLICLIPFYYIVRTTKFELSRPLRQLGYLVVIAFSLKIILQFLSAVPVIAPIASGIRHFIVAYLHLVLLGIVTLSLFGYYLTLGLLSASKVITRLGITVFVIAFFISEILAVSEGILNYSGSAFTNYNQLQLIAAAGILIGLIFIYSGRRKALRLRVSRIYIPSIINHSKYQS